MLWDIVKPLSEECSKEVTFSEKSISTPQNAWEARTQQRELLQLCYILSLSLFCVQKGICLPDKAVPLYWVCVARFL